MSGKPYQSKLTPYRKEILHAWYCRKTLKEIQSMLADHGITITLPGISLFIKRCRKRPDPHDLPPELGPITAKPRTTARKAFKKIESLMKRDPDEIKKEWHARQNSKK